MVCNILELSMQNWSSVNREWTYLTSRLLCSGRHHATWWPCGRDLDKVPVTVLIPQRQYFLLRKSILIQTSVYKLTQTQASVLLLTILRALAAVLRSQSLRSWLQVQIWSERMRIPIIVKLTWQYPNFVVITQPSSLHYGRRNQTLWTLQWKTW